MAGSGDYPASDRCGSKTTVSAAIDELARDGWLTKTARKSGGRDLSNVYQINVDKLEEAAAAARMANKSKSGWARYPQ